jgi:hypothetical protein
MQIEAMIGRLGDTGVTAIATALQQLAETASETLPDVAGN